MTESEKVTPQQLLSLLEEVVAAKGADYVYSSEESVEESVRDSAYDGSCRYVHHLSDGSKVPGCIVGTLLHDKFGVSIAGLMSEEGKSATYAVPFLLPEKFTSTTLDMLSAVQINQDGGMTWGEAVENVRRGFSYVLR